MPRGSQEWRNDEPYRSPRPDGGVHEGAEPPPAHAGSRGGDARLCGAARRRPRDVGDGGAAARLRLREVPEPRALAHRRSPRVGRAAAAREGRARALVPRHSRARDVHRRAAGYSDGADAVRGRRAVRLPGGVRAGAPVQELRGSGGVVGEEEAQGQGVRARGEPRRGASGSRGAGRGVGRAHRLRDSGAPSRGGRAGPRRAGARGVSVPATAALAARDQLTLALDRAAGARPIEGNRLEHHPDSPRALDAMLAAIVAARHWVHFENYIIRDDATGRRFADALAERARSGVRVRVLYDALGSFGTSRRYWRRLTQAGVEVRAFHPLLTRHPLDVFARDHRKLLATDGSWAMTGGLCIGNEWVGDPARGRRPWRDTMVAVTGPAAAALDDAFARIWRRAGAPLPPDELEADPAECGSSTARRLSGVARPARACRAPPPPAPGAPGPP